MTNGPRSSSSCHEGDVSGDVLAREADYCHLMIPMYFAPCGILPASMGRPQRTGDRGAI